jgi:phosphatidate cytidylyltransferase
MTSLPSAPDTPKKWALSNLAQRIITALALLPVVLGLTIAGGWGFTLLVMVIGVIGTLEFYLLARQRPLQGSALIGMPMALSVLLAFHFGAHELWLLALAVGSAATFALELLRHPGSRRRSLVQVGMTLMGVLYVAFPAGFLIALRHAPDPDGLLWLLLTLSITWGTDTFAYIGGRLWGRHKLAPLISPKKTVEGALVGVIGGIVPSLLLLIAGNRLTVGLGLLVLVAPFAAILGDLLESSLKRFFSVKDSHVRGLDIFPGHGGVLDRIDALIMVAVLNYFAIMVIGVAS